MIEMVYSMIRKLFKIQDYYCLVAIITWVTSIPTPSMGVERVIECHEPKGMSFDLKTPNNGWIEETSIVKGVSFIKEHDDHYDILIRYNDKTDIIKPSLGGYSLSHEDDDSFSIIINTKPLGILETFHVHLQNNGTGTLVWSTMKNNTPPTKTTSTSTYTLKCSY